MPKKKAKKIKAPAPVKLVTVRSRAYGAHTRAARGTIKPVKLNDALIAKGKQVAAINVVASAVHNLLKIHALFFKESMLWQQMLSRMHAATDTTPVALAGSLVGLELNSRYPLKRFGVLPFIKMVMEQKHMNIELRNNHTLRFNRKAAIYRYDVIVLFFNKRGKATGDVVVSTAWFATGEAAGSTVFDVALPASSTLYILCLRLHGGKDDEPLNELSSQGMSVVKAGSC